MFRISTVYLDEDTSASSNYSQILASFQPWKEIKENRMTTMRMSADTKIRATLCFGIVYLESPKT
jgi:hypothetical protein